MRYPLIHQKIFNEPWAIEPSAYNAVRQSYLAHCGISATIDGQAIDPAQISLGATGDSPASFARIGRVGIVSMSGILGKRLSGLETMCGGCDLDTYRAAFDAAYLDPKIDTIIQHAHSPGGIVTGGIELADHINALAEEGQKEIITYTDTVCASLAYLIGSQSHRVFAAPTARVGSIGTVVTLENRVKADAKAGISYRTYATGKFKDLGNPHREITDAEDAAIIKELHALNDTFVAAVSRARGISVDQIRSLEAAVFRGSQAQDKALTDGTADTLAELIEKI